MKAIKFKMEEVNKNKVQRIFQIILPMVSSFIIIGVCGFLLFSGVHGDALNLRILGDISAAFLLILIIPSGMLFLAAMIAFIYITHKSFNWARRIFPKIQSVFLRIDPNVKTICKTSAHPFIFFDSIYTIFRKKRNPEG